MNRQSNFAGLTTSQLRLISTSSPAAKPPFKDKRPEKQVPLLTNPEKGLLTMLLVILPIDMTTMNLVAYDVSR